MKSIKRDDQKKITAIRSLVFRNACTLHSPATSNGICNGSKPLRKKCTIAPLSEYVRGRRMLLMKYGPATDMLTAIEVASNKLETTTYSATFLRFTKQRSRSTARGNSRRLCLILPPTMNNRLVAASLPNPGGPEMYVNRPPRKKIWAKICGSSIPMYCRAALQKTVRQKNEPKIAARRLRLSRNITRPTRTQHANSDARDRMRPAIR